MVLSQLPSNRDCLIPLFNCLYHNLEYLPVSIRWFLFFSPLLHNYTVICLDARWPSKKKNYNAQTVKQILYSTKGKHR